VRPHYLIIGILTIGSASAGLGTSGIRALPDAMVRAAQAITGRDGVAAAPAQPDLSAVRGAYDTITERLARPVDPGLQSPAGPGPDLTALRQPMPMPKVNSMPVPESNVAAQVRQFDGHMQDLRTFERTPADWHAAPLR
jgi:hypothetical protein